jgi:hypothetical protein
MTESRERTYVPFIYCSNGGAGEDRDMPIFSNEALDAYARRQRLRDPAFTAEDGMYYTFFGEPRRDDVVMAQIVRDLGRRRSVGTEGTIIEIAKVDAEFAPCLVHQSDGYTEWIRFDKNKFVVDKVKEIMGDHLAGDTEKLARIRAALATIFPLIENEVLRE